ncbi:hypothetical protein Bca101_043969 [Brassica carinata]
MEVKTLVTLQTNEDQVESDDDEGKYFIQRRQTPERLFSMERPDVGTLQNLTSRIAALEYMDPFVHLVKRVIRLEKRANPKSQSRTYDLPVILGF